MHTLIAALAATPALVLGAAAQAQPGAACGRHDLVLAHLERHHDERVVAQALQADGRLLELTASPDGATWTALVTAPTGLACVVVAGRHLALLPPPRSGDGL